MTRAEDDDPRRSGAPAVVSLAAWRALASIRHEYLLREMFEAVAMASSAAAALRHEGALLPEWLDILEPPDEIEMPPRLVHLAGPDRDTVALAIALRSPMTLLEGKALLEKVKLSFIKAMSTVALIVQAYQTGRIRAARPLLVALERKGHEMPPPEQMAALLRALDDLA